jgi:putative endopeptidase
MRRVVNTILLTGGIFCIMIACQNKNVKESTILDLSSMDTSIRPQDDFFRYVNGTWLKNTAIPASESVWGSFVFVEEKANNDLHTLLDNLASNHKKYQKGSIEQLTADLYIAGMDSAAINKKGIEPLKSELQIIAAIDKPEGILNEVAREMV